MKSAEVPEWLLLILTLPGRQAALRVRTWRRLTALGVGALRDGVYVVPKRDDLHAALTALASDVRDAGGAAEVLEVHDGTADFTALFDRRTEYQAFLEELRKTAASVPKLQPARAGQTLRRLRRGLESIAARDFFPSKVSLQARTALDELAARIARSISPDEPGPARRRIGRLDPESYRGRTWVTRARPWVDRLASAWLIGRFIDRHARIRWMPKPPRRLGRSLGFDFDGATFTHVDGRVTFEVLLASFSLEADPTLMRIGAIVHYLDVGGLPVPEAAPVEALLHGIRERARTDQQLQDAANRLFDDLYTGYSNGSASS